MPDRLMVGHLALNQGNVGSTPTRAFIDRRDDAST